MKSFVVGQDVTKFNVKYSTIKGDKGNYSLIVDRKNLEDILSSQKLTYNSRFPFHVRKTVTVTETLTLNYLFLSVMFTSRIDTNLLKV